MEKIRTINQKIFSEQDESLFLLLGWLGKYGLSARTDKVENNLDDFVEKIHKEIYPDLHIGEEENEFPVY